METKQKHKILINPPPSDFRCEICGRKFDELPAFNKTFMNNDVFSGHRVFNKEHTEVRLFKTYRGSIQVSASWECAGCIDTSTIDDVLDYFTVERPENDYPEYDQLRLEKFLYRLRLATKKAKEIDDDYFFVDEFEFNTNYWTKYFSL